MHNHSRIDCISCMSLLYSSLSFFLSQSLVPCPSQWGWCLTPQARSRGQPLRSEWRSSLPTPGMLLSDLHYRYKTALLLWLCVEQQVDYKPSFQFRAICRSCLSVCDGRILLPLLGQSGSEVSTHVSKSLLYWKVYSTQPAASPFTAFSLLLQ